jgi:2-polyprenyl-3-methyl-5-hydroxy-6-metoxy-1,4-benzoquinol methylase
MIDWQGFFDRYAPQYEQECFTKNTEFELRFLLEKLNLEPGMTLLDVGCGTGRHSVGLAAAGLKVTGVDLSSGMLKQAAAAADRVGTTAEFVHSNAVDFVRPEAFDVAICLCEGAICLLGHDDDALTRDEVILENVFASLKPGGRFLMNVLSAFRHIRMYSDEDVASGKYDVLTLTERSTVDTLLPPEEGVDSSGEPGSANSDQQQPRERGYTPPEIRRMLLAAGFEVEGIYGGTAGAWNLQPPLLDEYELMIFSRKPA